MSDIQFNCPECGHSLAVDSAGAGMLVLCPECQKQITIPAGPPSPPPSGSNMPPPVMGMPRKMNRLPVIGLVLGIMGLWFMGLLAAIPAVICAHIGKARARKDPTGNGTGIATAGLVVGYMTVLTVFMGPCGLVGTKWDGWGSGVAAHAPIITAEAHKQKLQSAKSDLVVKGLYVGMDINDVRTTLNNMEPSWSVSDVALQKSDGDYYKVCFGPKGCETFGHALADIDGSVHEIFFSMDHFNVDKIMRPEEFATQIMHSYNLPRFSEIPPYPVGNRTIYSGWDCTTKGGTKVIVRVDSDVFGSWRPLTYLILERGVGESTLKGIFN